MEVKDNILVTKECAKKLKKTPAAIRNMVHRGTIPYRKCRGTLYFFESEIDAMIDGSPGKRLKDIEKVFCL